MMGKYRVVTLCGSTRFKEAFIQAQKRLTLEGCIVISVGLFGHSGDEEVWEGMSEDTLTQTKIMLDDMHKRKIDMADEIFVLNVGGYIGQSTRSEIAYARAHRKTVNYLEPPMQKALLVVDMQNDFIDGSLGTKEAQAITPRVAEKVALARKEGREVLFTRDTHHADYLSTPEGKKLPVVHCIEGTHGWEIASEIPTEGSIIVDKPTFGYTGWKEMGMDRFSAIEIVGLCTDICVVSNALLLKALYPEMRITVDSSCCAGVTPESHEAALQTMRMCQIDVC